MGVARASGGQGRRPRHQGTLCGVTRALASETKRQFRLMDLVVFLDQRYARTPDGAVWTPGPFPYSFFERYLTAFDRVRVVARVQPAEQPSASWNRAGGERVSFVEVPYYVGLWQYLSRAGDVRRTAEHAIGVNDAVLLRVPSQVSTSVEAALRREHRPYGVEVVGDPFEAYGPGCVRHPLRPVFRRWFRHRLRQQCASASGAAYVTAEALQRRYPAPDDAFTTNYSSVELPAEAFADQPRTAQRFLAVQRLERPFEIVTVGSLQYLYKGPDVLLEAAAICASRNLDFRLRFVGGGRYVETLQQDAARRRLGERVLFLGQLPAGEVVRAVVDEADLFVLPSRSEGLPRAMIEAMARGLPCIGTRVGGVPELLLAEDLVPASDAEALASKIIEVFHEPQRLTEMSARNLSQAQAYREEVLRERRTQYYSRLREVTERWLDRYVS